MTQGGAVRGGGCGHGGAGGVKSGVGSERRLELIWICLVAPRGPGRSATPSAKTRCSKRALSYTSGVPYGDRLLYDLAYVQKEMEQLTIIAPTVGSWVGDLVAHIECEMNDSRIVVKDTLPLRQSALYSYNKSCLDTLRNQKALPAATTSRVWGGGGGGGGGAK